MPALHLRMKAERGLPWTLAVSAFFEHSSDCAVRGFWPFLAIGAAGAAAGGGGAAAGAAVWAKAALGRQRESQGGDERESAGHGLSFRGDVEAAPGLSRKAMSQQSLRSVLTLAKHAEPIVSWVAAFSSACDVLVTALAAGLDRVGHE